jgi:4-aminobutyrate aminotransferase/(S)-3-amino-2-methylpropionate transaminase
MVAIDYRIPQERRLVTALPGPRSTKLAKRRAAAVAAGVSSSVPVYAVDADGGVIVDADGNSLIDLGSGIAVTTVGASNPAVAAAVARQAARFTHTCFMITPYEGYVAVAERLNALTPGTFAKRTALFNSGSEAVENAVKIARYATGRTAVVAFDHAYHGRTNLTLALTAKSMPYKHKFGPFTPEVYRAPMSYPFREGRNADGSPITGEQAARRAISMIDRQIGADRLAAVVLEPIQGEGGFIVPAPGFLPTLTTWAAKHGVVFVADEVQTGFARTGAWFASEHEGVAPDLITTAKGIAGGLPLAGVTGRAELMDSVHPGGLGGTYGGNPVSCAASLAAIDQIERLDLIGRARRFGELALPRLRSLADELADGGHGIVGDVRGRGAMLAVEFVEPGGSHPTGAAPNPTVTREILARLLSRGVVALACGTYGNVIRLLPPLTMPDELFEQAVSELETAIREVAV